MSPAPRETIAARWLSHVAARPAHEAVVFLRAGEPPLRWTWGALHTRATLLRARLAAAGIRPGEVCAIVIRHHPDFHPLYFAIELLGAIPAVLAYPNARLHPDKFRAGLEGMARHSGLDWLLTERDLEPVVRPLALGTDATVRGIVLPLEGPDAGTGSVSTPEPPHPSDPDAPCLLQHSSGTTGLQKAVMLSHDAVLRHVENYARAIQLAPGDRIVSWLPLYHDMGLIAAFHLALATGTPTVQLDPFEWITAPSLFLEALASERGTIGWLPNFAYNLMTQRVHDDDLAGVRLDSLRLLVNCSEPVRAESHAAFARRFAPLGLNADALGASYAMAETTFAVTQTRPGRAARTLSADRDALRDGSYRVAANAESARDVASSGNVIEGCAVRVLDNQGREVEDGRIGELVIRSDSMFDGYRGAPEKTAEALRDGWYWSGDFGFVWESEVYVIGRKKDLIIVAGKNLHPEDIEDEIGSIAGILPGRVVAFGMDDETSGTQQVWVAAETEVVEESARRALRSSVVAAGMRIDVTIAQVRLVAPRWLIKSSAGKISRSANRERLLAPEADERVGER